MIGIPPLLPFKPVGVNSDKGCPNVRFPLLLTYRLEKMAPKKFTEKGSGIAEVEPSSFAGNAFVMNPGSCLIVPLAVICEMAGLAGSLDAGLRSAVRGPAAFGVAVTLMEHWLPSPGTLALHELVCPKSAAAFPANEIPSMATAPSPLLV